MKNLLTLTLALACTNFISPIAFGYTEWKSTVPETVYRTARQSHLRMKLMVNSCSGIFEGQRVRAETLGCETDENNITRIRLKLEYKNRVNCDQGMEYLTTVSVDLKTCQKMPQDALFEAWGSKKHLVQIRTQAAYRAWVDQRKHPERYEPFQICENEHHEKVVIRSAAHKIDYYLNDQFVKTLKYSFSSGSHDGSATYQDYSMKGPPSPYGKLLFSINVNPKAASPLPAPADGQSYFNQCVTKLP